MAAFGGEEGEVPEEMDESELDMQRQGLFKVMIVDQQNQPTGVAYVTQEQADQITAGLLTVQLTADNQVREMQGMGNFRLWDRNLAFEKVFLNWLFLKKFNALIQNVKTLGAL